MTGLSSDGFQNVVNIYPAPAVPGDFAGANIRANVVGGGQEYVASPAGVPVGTIGWANPVTGVISSYYQPSSFPCFIHRDNQGLITQFLGISTVLVPGNTEITGMDQGDFWGLFAGGATVTQKVYANAVTGALTSAATGNGVTGAITSLSVATTGVMTVATITGTPLAVGQIITAVGVPPGSYIGSLGTGAGGAGTYNLINADGTPFTVVTTVAGTYNGVTETQFYVAQAVQAAVTSTANTIAAPVAGTSGASILTTSGALSSGVITQGMFVTGTGVAANTQILYQLSGTTGAAGGATYAVTAQAAVASFTASFAGGLLGKISSWTRST